MIEWIAGIFVGLIVHEAAHELTARVSGGQMEWNSRGEWIYQGPNGKAVAIAGLAAQAISSEILIRRKQTNFTKGWLAFNVGDTVFYAIRNEVAGGYGDLGNFTMGEARKIEVVLLAHSYSVARRMKWQFFPTHNGVQMRIAL